ncbi:MAG: PEP-CTERM sorting domain-containing protein, partial [Vicinamibacterales bacterium]
NCRRGRRPGLLGDMRDIVSTFRKMSTEADQAHSQAAASTVTIDTSASWTDLWNYQWDGSGQSLTVPTVENILQDIGFYFHEDSQGETFTLYVSDAMNDGETLFTTPFTVTTGLNVITTNLVLAPGSLAFALIDYNGFSEHTAAYIEFAGYDGGQSVFKAEGSFTADFESYDHRFIANFTDSLGGPVETLDVPNQVPVPEPGTLVLLGTGAAALAARRRKQHS